MPAQAVPDGGDDDRDADVGITDTCIGLDVSEQPLPPVMVTS